MRTESILSAVGKPSGRAALALKCPGPERYPLWLWWNLLSLDAPTIVCVWALLFMRALNIQFRGWEIAALVSAVWIIYAGDRILDGLRRPNSLTVSERHIFYARHTGSILAVLLPLVFATAWIGVERLDSQTRLAGLAMSAAVVFYLLAIHGVPDRATRWFPKEAVTGGIFAVGAALPAWIHAAESRKVLLSETLLFGGLCVLNCVAIECWEHNRGDRRWEQPPYWLIQWADRRIAPIAVTLFLCSGWIGIFVLHNGGSADLLSASSISLLAVLAIEWQSHALSRQALRVLADAALLTPLVFLLRWVV